MVTLLLFLALSAQSDFRPPDAGKPMRFNGAVGVFSVVMTAEPTTVMVEKPIRLTVRITAQGEVRTPPKRPDLAAEEGFDAFYIEKPSPADARPDERTWEFYYVLKPRSTAVTEIPLLPFCFFDPRFGSNARGYQTPIADAIEIKVTPRDEPPPDKLPRADLPDFIAELPASNEVLRRDRAWTVPGPLVLAALLLGPPLCCLAWVLVWARLNPDEARLTRMRRSRAVRQALKALRAGGDAGQTAGAVARYLRERLDLPAVSPTPSDVAGHLDRLGASPELRRKALVFFEACDAARYGPAHDGAGLAEQGAELVLAVEAEPWASN